MEADEKNQMYHRILSIIEEDETPNNIATRIVLLLEQYADDKIAQIMEAKEDGGVVAKSGKVSPIFRRAR